MSHFSFILTRNIPFANLFSTHRVGFFAVYGDVVVNEHALQKVANVHRHIHIDWHKVVEEDEVAEPVGKPIREYKPETKALKRSKEKTS